MGKPLPGLSALFDSGETWYSREVLYMDEPATKADIGLLKSDIGSLQSGMGLLGSTVGLLQSDVSQLKSDVGQLKSDVGQLKSDVGQLKSQTGALKTEILGILRSEMHDLRTELRQEFASKEDLKREVALINKRLDLLSLHIVKTNARIDDLETRLTAKIDAGFDWMKGTLIAFTERMETYSRESVTLPKTLDAHGERIQDHERRIHRLESLH